jgi:hypothetical protein
VDFHDVKGDVEALLQYMGARDAVSFEAAAGMPCLHPGRSAQLVHAGRVVGYVGEINPALMRGRFDISPGAVRDGSGCDRAGIAAQFRDFSRIRISAATFPSPWLKTPSRIRDRVVLPRQLLRESCASSTSTRGGE